LEKLYNQYRRQGLVILAPDMSYPGTPNAQFFIDHKMSYPVTTPLSARTWGVNGTPAVFLVKNGKIVAQWRPDRPLKEDELERTILRHLRE
jgi:hypothetical protein